jgi:hypothetical protein
MVHVSADARYVLWVNDRRVGRGPLKGTPTHYFYETYDLSEDLRAGQNALAAEVRWFGRDAPTSEMHTCYPGFLLQGPEGAGLDTPEGWKVLADGAVSADTTSYIANAAGLLGAMDVVDLRKVPRGWTEAGFDDSGWEAAVGREPARDLDKWGTYPRRRLFPREVPALLEEARRFRGSVRDNRRVEHLFGAEPAGWTVPAGEEGEIVLDAGELTTGYPVLEFAGGADRQVYVTYAECAFQREGGGKRPRKGVRDDIENGQVVGYRDTLHLPGGEAVWEPFHWRTFWFVKISVSAGESELCLRDARYRFTTYPQELKAEYASSDPDSEKILRVSWHTLQLCSHETYEDCPYYEQLQYAADSRLEALLSLTLAGETRLPRRCIRQFQESVRHDGLLQSRFPSSSAQIIPQFPLFWILMLEDYWRWVGPAERDFVRSCLGAVEGVLWFFRERLRDDGFVGELPGWRIVDNAPGWPVGEPPAVIAGESTYMTCLYAYALQAAVRLHRGAGRPSDAERWEPVAEQLRRAVRTGAWSEEEGLFLEGPGRAEDRLSQHSQMMAILCDAAAPEQTARILQRLTSDASLIRAKLMQSFYLARALEKAGAYGAVATHVLEPWREMLELHLSTWAEYLPGRSDCHAWSAWPALDFVNCVLGVRPARPGFEEVVIRPHPEAADWARGSLPSPAGPIGVSWERDPETGEFCLQAQVPPGVPAVVDIPGGEPRRYPEGGRISVGR